MNRPPDKMTAAEAAEALNVTERRIQQMCKVGILAAVTWGRAWMIDRASVEQRAQKGQGDDVS
jgi:excisionase family DNA binding protein